MRSSVVSGWKKQSKRKINLDVLSLEREDEIRAWLDHYGVPEKVKNRYGGHRHLHNIIIGYIISEALEYGERLNKTP